MLDVSAVTRQFVDTTEPVLAHQWLTETYSGHGVHASHGDVRLRAQAWMTNRFRVDDVHHSGHVRVDLASGERVLVHRLHAGSFRLDGGCALGPRVDGLVLLEPAHGVSVEWDDVDVGVVALDLTAVRAVGSEMSGLAPTAVRLQLAGPVDEARARYWRSTVEHVRTAVLDVDDVAEQPLARAEALRSLAVATLVTFPNTALNALAEATTATGPSQPGTVRRAVAFIDAHAHEEIGLAQIAAAARLGPRGLQVAFRRYRDETPLTYLRRVRMDRAHRDLTRGDPTHGDTVAAIAASWGFTHAGRFSVEYRRAYDRSPGETLRSG